MCRAVLLSQISQSSTGELVEVTAQARVRETLPESIPQRRSREPSRASTVGNDACDGLATHGERDTLTCAQGIYHSAVSLRSSGGQGWDADPR